MKLHSLLMVLAGLSLAQVAAGRVMVCYYENWAQYRPGVQAMRPKDIDPYLCTHIVYAFARVVDNELLTYEWNDFELYAEAVALKKRNPELKVILAVGGWTHGTANFTKMVSTESNMNHFILTSIEYLRQHKLDGLDLDWEYPALRGSPPEDRERFPMLCQKLKLAFMDESLLTGSEPLLLTAALGAGNSTIAAAYDVPKIAESLDLVFFMLYDYAGSWKNETGLNAPLFGERNDNYTIDFSVRYLMDRGMPASKIVMGLPTYGQSWNASQLSNDITPGQNATGLGTVPYRDICSNPNNLANTVYDRQGMVPYTRADGRWISYDDQTSFITKCEYIEQKKFAGAMIWALGQDDHNGKSCDGNPNPLLATISNCIGTCSSDNFVCPRPFGYYADSCNCSRFFQCTLNFSYHMTCPQGTLWNQRILNCDWPENVKCFKSKSE